MVFNHGCQSAVDMCTPILAAATTLQFITFRVTHSRGEMYIGHGRLCVCVSVCPRRISTLLHGPGCNLGEW